MTISYRGVKIASYGYKYTINRYRLQDANTLIIPLNRRRFSLDSINITKIIPDKILKLNPTELQLTGIISYQGEGHSYHDGHYFGYFSLHK